MNNPFLRLKHFLPDKIDPQENHATECLAACLVFSAKIREVFIQFLLDGGMKGFSLGEVEVVTQHPIDSGGYIDLVLRQGERFVIAVEVKVKALENDPRQHHRQQLKAYKKWVSVEAKANGYLFTLVRNPDAGFRPEEYGANGRRTWSELYKCFKTVLRVGNLSDVESSLIKNLCDYLESEAIVSTYETKDLLDYAAGLQARKAVTGIFNQIASRVEADGFTTVSVEDRRDYWPQLRIQNPRWKRIFGNGENRKIVVWFCVPGIWDASQHEFCPEIELWHVDHGNDWPHVKSKLPSWLRTLKSQNFGWTVFQTWTKSKVNMSAKEIQDEPKKITAWKDGDSVILKADEPLNEDDLVNVLVSGVKQYAEIISSLKA